MTPHVLTAFFCLVFAAAAQTPPLELVSRQTVFDFGAGKGSSYLSPEGELYIAGLPTYYSFPAPTLTIGDTSYPPDSLYITKFNAANHVAFNVAIGGTTGSLQLVFDRASNPYILGFAYTAKFPATPGAYRTSAGATAPFVCMLRRDTGSPVYCTYLDVETTSGFYADSSGAIILVGTNPTHMPATPGALSRGSAIYVGRLNPQGTAMSYMATFGGSGNDILSDFAIDSTGAITVTGFTTSKDFPTTSHSAVPRYPDGALGTTFVARINPAGTDFEYSTLGYANEAIAHLGLGPDRSAFISLTSGRIRKYSADGSVILFDVPLPPQLNAYAQPIADSNGGTLVLATTTATNFPQIAQTGWCAFRTISSAGVLLHLNAEGSIVQSTYLPGSAGAATFGLYSTDGDRLTLLEYHSTVLSTLTLAPASSSVPAISCVGSGATFVGGPIAPGEIVTLFGDSLAPAAASLQLGANGRYPLEAGGLDVLFDGVPGALLYVSPTQINAVVPWILRHDGVSHVCVRDRAVEKGCIDVGAAPVAPGIFRASDGNAAAVNQDGTINTATNPATAGSIVSLFVTGLGQVNPTPLDGDVTQFPLPSLVLRSRTQVLVPSPLSTRVPLFDALPTLYIGPAPLEVAGLQQINVQVSNVQSLYVEVRIPDNTQFGTTITDSVMIWIK